jgi:Secretion system C-terminal sorting domain
MKKIIIVTCAIIFSANVVAQTEKKATIRLKRVENINGVERITDTSFLADGASVIQFKGENIDIQELNGRDSSVRKVIIINDTDESSKAGNGVMKLEKRDAELEKLMKEMDLKDLEKGMQKVIIYKSWDENDIASLDKLDKLSKSNAVLINITNANTEDKKKFNEKVSADNDQLKVERFDFFPNPSNGKFNLSFNLPNKGDTKVSVLSMDSKIVYNKNLNNFTGDYKTEINISERAKGIYFIKVEQNGQSILKKIVLE